MSKGKKFTVGCTSALALAALTCLVHAQPPATKGKAAALVNGEAIPAAEVASLVGQALAAHPETEGQKAARYKMALDMLIGDVLMRQFLRKNVRPITPAEVNKELAELQNSLAKQTPTKTLQDFFKETGQSEEELRSDIAARLQWKVWLTARLPDQTIKVYYDANKLFFDKVLVRASHILLRVPPTASEADKQALRARLVAIRQEIFAGKISFEDAAKTYSDCPSKASGGDIGHFPYKFAVQEAFAKAAFALPKGSVSDVVATDFGFHLIKVTERKEGEPSNFETIKDVVRDVYAQDVELYQTVIAEERKTARIEIMPQ